MQKGHEWQLEDAVGVIEPLSLLCAILPWTTANSLIVISKGMEHEHDRGVIYDCSEQGMVGARAKFKAAC